MIIWVTFLNWWVSPTTIGFSYLKMHHFCGGPWGYHHLRKNHHMLMLWPWGTRNGQQEMASASSGGRETNKSMDPRLIFRTHLLHCISLSWTLFFFFVCCLLFRKSHSQKNTWWICSNVASPPRFFSNMHTVLADFLWKPKGLRKTFKFSCGAQLLGCGFRDIP